MQSLRDIEKAIQPVLKRVEKIRRGTIQRTWMSYFIPLFITGLSFYFGVDLYSAGKGGYLLFFFFPVLLWWFVFALQEGTASKESKYLSIFRQQVLGALVEQLYPKASYHHYTSIDKKELEKSQFFSFVDKHYQLEDYFIGHTHKGVRFKFAELDNGEGTPSKGVFFEVDLPQQEFLPTPILLLPIQEATALQKLKADLSLQTFLEQQNITYWKEEEDFYAPYVIYCQQPAQLPQVLTPALLGAVYNLYQQWGRYLQVSMVGEKLYLFLEYEEDWLETSLQQPVLKSNLLKDLYSQLVVCFQLLEDLGREDWQPSKIAMDKIINWEKELYKHLIVK